MNKNNINVSVFCGDKGTGKSTYVIEKWPNHILLQCDNPLNDIKTASVLGNALSSIYGEVYLDISAMVSALRTALSEGKAVIIDCAEYIDIEMLKIVVNTLIPMKSSMLIFTFDVDVRHLFQNKIFRLLIEWDIISADEKQENFRMPRQTFEEVVAKSLHGVSADMVNELLEISNYNFISLKRLIWLVINHQDSYDHLSKTVVAEYSYVMIEERFSDIPQDMFDVLKKSSIIGEIFQRCVLESQNGFHILGVKRYLEELEAMDLFIHSYLSDEKYRFVSNQIHEGVIKSIEPKQRIAWEQVLLNYYLEKLKSAETNDEILEYLLQTKRLSVSLNENRTTFFANKNLLYRYSVIKDTDKALGVLDELIQYCKRDLNDSGLYGFLCYYKICINIKNGEFSTALDAIDNMNEQHSIASSLYLQYYRALSLYNIGDVDQSYAETLDLIQKLVPTSAKAVDNQPIYALSYSLMATLQNHFGIGDCGKKYYALALNHSRNKLDDKTTYYEILKKSDMYFSYSFTKSLHSSCIAFFESNGNDQDVAEVCLNLATEMMFNERDRFDEAMTLFNRTLGIFESTPNWKLAYAKNNLALLHILYTGDFNTAASLLEEALLVGMSAFTYFTIYLNLCMCYLVLHGPSSMQFQTAYESFVKYHTLVSSRKNATQYDDIYKQITDLIILEHTGHENETNIKAQSVLSQNANGFFTPVLQEIIDRTDFSDKIKTGYSENINFYVCLNKYRIFLAEFRFWE